MPYFIDKMQDLSTKKGNQEVEIMGYPRDCPLFQNLLSDGLVRFACLWTEIRLWF